MKGIFFFLQIAAFAIWIWHCATLRRPFEFAQSDGVLTTKMNLHVEGSLFFCLPICVFTVPLLNCWLTGTCHDGLMTSITECVWCAQAVPSASFIHSRPLCQQKHIGGNWQSPVSYPVESVSSRRFDWLSAAVCLAASRRSLGEWQAGTECCPGF